MEAEELQYVGYHINADNKGKLNTLASTYKEWFIDTPSGDENEGIHRTKKILEDVDKLRKDTAF